MLLFSPFLTHLVQLLQPQVDIGEHPGVLATGPLQLLASLLLVILLFGLRGDAVGDVRAQTLITHGAGERSPAAMLTTLRRPQIVNQHKFAQVGENKQ